MVLGNIAGQKTARIGQALRAATVAIAAAIFLSGCVAEEGENKLTISPDPIVDLSLIHI